jgi:hypothetical protein
MANRWDVNMRATTPSVACSLASVQRAFLAMAKEIYSVPGFEGRVTDRETGRAD